MSDDHLRERDEARQQDAEQYLEVKIRALRIAFASATSQALIKGAAGLLTGSIGLLSTAVDSLGDLLNVTIARVAVALGGRPPDSKHTFGYGKVEPLGALLQAVLVLPVAGGVLRQAIRRFTIGGEVEKPLIAMLVMAVMLVVGVWTARILRREAERTDSLSLQGSALTFSVDAATHLGVLVALGVVQLTGWMIADAIAGILVAVYVLVCTTDLVWKSCRDLLDTQVPEEYRRRIIEELSEHEGEFLDYHRLRTRRAGSEKHIDFHLTVCRYRTLEETHRLVDHLENALEAIIPQSQVIIHVDPCVPGATCPSEDTCTVAVDRRHVMPESDWPAHPTGAEARVLEKVQHPLDHPDGNGSADSS